MKPRLLYTYVSPMLCLNYVFSLIMKLAVTWYT